MKFKLLSLLAIALLAWSCSDDPLMSEKGSTGRSIPSNDEEIVLQERDLSLPSLSEMNSKIEARKNTITRNVVVDPLIGNSSVLLGYSYRVGNGILGDFDNVCYPVINTNELGRYIDGKKLLHFTSESFSFYNQETYVQRIQESQTISGSVGFGYKLFGINISATYQKTFYSETTSLKEHLNSELTMTYNDVAYTLNSAEGARKIYASKYLTSQFLYDLYNSPMSELLNRYGEFVLTGYNTGGKANALFVADIEDTSKKEQEKTQFDLAVKASLQYSAASGDTAKVSMKFGKSKVNFSETGNLKKTLRTKLSLYGGIPSGIGGIGAQNLTDVDLNLDDWLKSIINDPSKHTIVSISKNGLVPIFEFVFEQNFRGRLEDTANGLLPAYPGLQEPRFEIERVFVKIDHNDLPLYAIRPVLVTRQGDKIVFPTSVDCNVSDAELSRNVNANIFNDKALKIKNEIMKRFQAGTTTGLKIVSKPNAHLNPTVRDPLCFDLSSINMNYLKKWRNPYTHVLYIYDEINHCAFSTYADELDEDGTGMLSYYGFSSNWINSIPNKALSLQNLTSYTVIGL